MRLDREYLRTGTRYHRSENGVENSDHFLTCLPILVQFSPQTAKNYLIIFVHYIVIMPDASSDAGAAVVGGRGWAASLTTRPLKHEPLQQQQVALHEMSLVAVSFPAPKF